MNNSLNEDWRLVLGLDCMNSLLELARGSNRWPYYSTMDWSTFLISDGSLMLLISCLSGLLYFVLMLN